MLVLLHGFACLPSMWDAVVAALPEQMRACSVRPLLPGHGPEPLLPRSTRFDEVVGVVAAALPSPPWHLVGYSLGARIALSLALAHPDRVEALTLVGVNAGLEDDEIRRARRRWDQEQAVALERDGLEAFFDRWQELPLFASQRRLPSALRTALRRQRLSHTPEGLGWAMRTLGLGNMPPLASQLATTARPITLVAGGDDSKFVAEAERIAELAPAARCHFVPGVGHNVALEAPAALARLIAGDEPGAD